MRVPQISWFKLLRATLRMQAWPCKMTLVIFSDQRLGQSTTWERNPDWDSEGQLWSGSWSEEWGKGGGGQRCPRKGQRRGAGWGEGEKLWQWFGEKTHTQQKLQQASQLQEGQEVKRSTSGWVFKLEKSSWRIDVEVLPSKLKISFVRVMSIKINSYLRMFSQILFVGHNKDDDCDDDGRIDANHDYQRDDDHTQYSWSWAIAKTQVRYSCHLQQVWWL